MKEELTLNIAEAFKKAGRVLQGNTGLDCDAAQELMSPFIDSMASAEEVERLQVHVSACPACRRQLQSFISARHLLMRIEQPEPPEDLALETRVKLSQERYKNVFAQLETRLSNALKPIALPAIFGVSLTMLFFGILLGGLISNTTVMAHERVASDRIVSDRIVASYKFARTTDPTMISFAGSESKNWDEPLMIETHVGDDGRVIDYEILSGKRTPEVVRWIREMLYFAQFRPATAFGRPVDSKIILSFVAVRS
jgi:hypothetical protein